MEEGSWLSVYSLLSKWIIIQKLSWLGPLFTVTRRVQPLHKNEGYISKIVITPPLCHWMHYTPLCVTLTLFISSPPLLWNQNYPGGFSWKKRHFFLKKLIKDLIPTLKTSVFETKTAVFHFNIRFHSFKKEKKGLQLFDHLIVIDIQQKKNAYISLNT